MEKQQRTLGEKVIRAISSGKVDDDLEDIIRSATNRKRYLTDKAALDLLRRIKPGDKVRLERNLKPKYLGGMHGVVDSVDRSKSRRGLPMVSVDLGAPVRRYGRRILVPLACIEMLEPAPEEEESVHVISDS